MGASDIFPEPPQLFSPQREKPRAPGDVEEKANQRRASLRYEGKSFEEWREAGRTELSAEKRLEAVKALAAFGANGYGRGAAQAILDAARQYDWNALEDTKIGQLKGEIVATFAGRYDGSPFIAWNDWLPLVVAEARSGDARAMQFAGHVFGQFQQYQKAGVEPNKENISKLLELSRDDALKGLRDPMLGVLTEFYVRTRDEQIAKRMEELLAGDASEIHTALNALYDRPYQEYMRQFHSGRGRMGGAEAQAPPFDAAYRPQLAALLRHDNPNVRLGAVRVLAILGEKAAAALPHLLPLTLEPATEQYNPLMDIRSALQAITGSDQALVAYWQKVIQEKSLPPEKEKLAQEQLRNWEQEHNEADRRLFDERRGGGREESPDPRR
jgi:hypothetical protein